MSEHSERYLGNPTQTVLFIIGCILIIFSLSSLILIICSIYHHDKNETSKISRKQSLKRKWKSVKSVNYPTILSATFYFLSTCSYLAALYYFDDEAADNFGNSFRFVIAMVTFVAFIFSAKISIYTQFVARLLASFKGSYLEPSQCTLKVCITLLTLSWCTIIWWIVLLSVRYIILKEKFDGYYTQFYFVFSLLFIFDFTMSWLVVGLFTKKLFATMMLKDRGPKIKNTVNSLQLNNVYGIDDGDDWTPCTESMLTDICATTIDEDDQRRLNLIRKQVILSAITISTSQLSYISLLIILIIKKTAGYNDNFQPKLYSLYAGAFYPMDVILNCIILYFNYRFADKYYHMFCCCFERVCKNCAIKYMAKRIVKQYNDEKSMNDYVIMTDQNNQSKNVCCCPSLCSNGNDKDSAQSHMDV